MLTDTHGNGNGLDDLLVLPETLQEEERIIQFARERGLRYALLRSDVKGQSWYGKLYFNFPFGSSLAADLRQFVGGH